MALYPTWVNWSSVLILSFLLSPLSVKCDETHYLLYSVNPGEGFNLRRDVYVRAAALVKALREKEDWVLVLPPWPHLPHWNTEHYQDNIKWEKFFNLPSLNEYVPVIEFDDYLKKEGQSIDEVRRANWSGMQNMIHSSSIHLSMCALIYKAHVHIAHKYSFHVHLNGVSTIDSHASALCWRLGKIFREGWRPSMYWQAKIHRSVLRYLERTYLFTLVYWCGDKVIQVCFCAWLYQDTYPWTPGRKEEVSELNIIVLV